MCGIAGIWHYNGEQVSEQKLKRFTDSMTHRGPDGAGYEFLCDKTLALGHRRLAILDLTEAGKQPFYYLDRYCITYNGEVFNFMDIRKTLEQKGYTFRSETDTEVIVAAYDHYGPECLHHFNGMWAFAIWDEKEQTLFMARDRFGIKPLYYTHISGKHLAFASETRAFKYLDDFDRQFEETLLAMEVQDPYSLEGIGYTTFKDIYQLLPGHYMKMAKGDGIVQKRWWHIDEQKHVIPKTLQEQAAQFYEIFRDACRIRLISDVPVATALSGGVDSTAIYSTVSDILKHETHKRINTNAQLAVSAVFPGLENDEQRYVEDALKYTGGPVKWIETDYSNLAADIEKDTELFDGIASGPITAIAAIYRGMKQAGITVSLDGHGVDEMLYGYLDMVYALYNDARFSGRLKDMDRYANVLKALYHPDNNIAIYERFEKETAEAKSKPIQALKQRLKNTIKPAADRRFLPADLPALSDKPYDFSGKPIAQRMVYYEFFQHTLPALLRNFDRASMMNSVEIRMPFMDWRLVSYVFSLPVESKIGNGYTKLILREAMKDRMTESIRTRTHKIGVGSPVKHWFDNYLKTWFSDKLATSKRTDKDTLQRQLSDYYSTPGASQQTLFTIWKNLNAELIR